MRKDRGFTVIELMITMAVVAIAVTVAVPTFTSVIKSNRLTTDANLFITAASYARAEAVRTGIATQLVAINDDWSDGWQVIETTGNTVIREFPALKGGETLASAGDMTFYQFQPTGRLTVLAGDTLTLCDDRTGETGRQLSISGVGRVSATTVACP